MGILQVVRVFEGVDVQVTACRPLRAIKVLPLMRPEWGAIKGHPLFLVNNDHRSGHEVIQVARPRDSQVIKAVRALECELAVLGVVE